MKKIPRTTPDRIAYAQFATRGVLARLALMFNANGEQHFSGIQVAEILVTASAAICQNPLHACCDGSASPHAIGPSCMAEPSEEKS